MDYDENSHIVLELKERLKKIGESLWHRNVIKKISRIRKTNNRCKFLG